MTCAALQTYIDKTQGFSDNLANVLSGPMNIIFASMAGFWAVMCGFRLAISSVDGKTLAKEALWVMVAAVLLGTKGTTLISTAYTDSITVMGSAAGAVFSIASTASVSGDGMQGMTALAANGEKALTTIFQIVGALAGKGGVTDGSLITNTIYAIILGFPYVILMIFYAAHIVIAIFRATMVGLFAPLLFMALGFSQTRDMAISGAKVLLGSILVLFAVTAALSLSIYGVTSTITIDPKTIVAGTSDNFASITSANYIVALFMGWAGVAFLAEGASIANAIAGAGLTETATAIMTGALAMAMKGLSKMIGNPIGAGLAKVGGAALGGAGNQAKRLVDAFKNINKS